MAEDNSWVFDSLVCFLHGPIWNAPLQTFIEEKSLIFDPNILPVDDTNPEYQKIHDEYKNLVDYMLGSFMEEMQITPEQFETACLEGRNQQPDNPFNFHQGLFQQIWAANDIKIFIRMMTQRNVELQLQALDLIERRQLPLSSDVTAQNIVETKIIDSIDKNDTSVNDEVFEKQVENEITHPPYIDSTDKDLKEKDKFDRLNLFFENQQINPEDVKSRQEYLRAQRDKILEIKKKTRARQLNETVKKSVRPSSAQIAQQILEGNADELVAAGSSDRNSASLKLRKMLAQRLRTEVVDETK